ncbi:MAG: wax ester/triacylglycerol synthase family O-acyltransferase [bacterium]|nr:wax ester/triacylglycerol synthase family O-acyltransferase [bacterium]
MSESESYSDRLTMLDNSFLVYENEDAGMHIASTQVFDAGPLRGSSGAIDIDRISEYVNSRLDRIPRYRQRLQRTPIERHPVWIDDADFNISYHVRHSALPQPGSERQLKRLVGRIFSQRLDRDKPLWELWVVEGIEGDRVALISKVHHCMVDGVSGAELISELLTPEPVEKVDIPRSWSPRPAPSKLQLGMGEVSRVIGAPRTLLEEGLKLLRNEGDTRHDLAERARALARLASEGSHMATPVPFNQPIGPHRRIDWLPMSIDRIRAVRRKLGGSLNDVVLATAAGGLARYLENSRGVDLASLDFRVMTPVSVRAPDQDGTLGNRVSAWMVPLPLAEPDPRARLKAIQETTQELKDSRQALGAYALTQATEWTGSALLSLGARLMTLGTPFNMVITNVPGPQMPLYLLESRMQAAHPLVPLLGQLGLGIALFSYAGTLSWGFSADWNIVPDLHELVLATEQAFEELENLS